MSASRNGNPDHALHRMAGTEEGFDMFSNSLVQLYATSGDLQRRHIRYRCGVSRVRARLIAGLVYGECT